MKSNRQTSSRVAKIASQKLKIPTTTSTVKTVSGSALSQVKATKVTSKSVASKASSILRSPHTSSKGKSVGGSVLGQKNRK